MKLSQRNSTEYVPPISITSVSIDGGTTSLGEETRGSSIFESFLVDSGWKEYNISYPFFPLSESVLTPNIFTIADGYAQRLQSGIGKLKVSYGTYSSVISLDFSSLVNYTFEIFSNFTIGSYGRAALEQIGNFIGEKTGTINDLLYYNGSSYSEAVTQPGGIARNINCWAADIDFSGVCIYSHLFDYYGGGFFGGGALITPRHYIVSHHFAPANRVGRQLRFLGVDGVVYERTIIAQTTGSEIGGTFANPSIPVGDLCLFLLDSDLPGEVTVYPIVGDWIVGSEFVSTNVYNNEYASPFITIDQQRRVKFSVCSTILNNFQIDTTPVIIAGNSVERKSYSGLFKQTIYTNYDNFQSNAISGDSGSPVFALMPEDNSLALYTLMTTPTTGTVIHQQLANAMISEVDTRAGISTGYTVTVAAEPII